MSEAVRSLELEVAGAGLVADPLGVLYCPEHRALAVADLHFEKGSSYARDGVFLPPYDSASTLGALDTVIARYAPRVVLALGDSFHDRDGPARLAAADRERLAGLQRGREWIWITGNHDPEVNGVGGSACAAVAFGPLVFRHIPAGDKAHVAGHLHPVARIRARGRVVSRRCFVSDGERLVMPAFGAYAGGLNVRDPAFGAVFADAFTAHMLGSDRLYSFAAKRCVPDG